MWEIEEQLMNMYQDPELREKPALLEKRGGAYYSKSAALSITPQRAERLTYSLPEALITRD